MTLARLGIAWALCAVWFLVWEQLERQTGGRTEGPNDGGLGLRAPLWIYLADALLVTLFGALWFASLGHGGWWLLFLVLGLVVEGPGRYRSVAGGMPAGGRSLAALLLGVLRLVGAGGILGWRL